MTADGHIVMNRSKPGAEAENMRTRFHGLVTGLDRDPTEEQASFIRAMVQASWTNYTRHYPDHARLQDSFEVEIMKYAEEASDEDCQSVYIFTRATGCKYVIA